MYNRVKAQESSRKESFHLNINACSKENDSSSSGEEDQYAAQNSASMRSYS